MPTRCYFRFSENPYNVMDIDVNVICTYYNMIYVLLKGNDAWKLKKNFFSTDNQEAEVLEFYTIRQCQTQVPFIIPLFPHLQVVIYVQETADSTGIKEITKEVH